MEFLLHWNMPLHEYTLLLLKTWLGSPKVTSSTASAWWGPLTFPPPSRGSTKVPRPTLVTGPALPAATSL